MNLKQVFHAAPLDPGAPDREGKGMTRLFLVLFVPLTLLLLVDAACSLKWRMFHDYPTMAYLSFLTTHYHWVPYRDFIDMNMPGNHLVNGVMGRIFGYSDLGFRLLDLTTLSVLLLITWLWLKRIHWRVAWAAMAGFGFLYLGNGPIIGMQREFILLVPVSVSLAVLTAPRISGALKAFAIGFCFGSAFLIKPHAVMGYPVLFLFLLLEVRESEGGRFLAFARTARLAAWTTAGFLLPVGLTTAWLWKNGALAPFLDMARNYWPLYGRTTGGHEVLSRPEWVKYLRQSYLDFNGMRLLFWPAGLGLIFAFLNSRLNRSQKRTAVLTLLLVFLYSLYVLLAGKFWPYHWILFMYFLTALGALCYIPQRSPTRVLLKLLPFGVFFLTFFCQYPFQFWKNMVLQVRGHTYYDDKIARGDVIAGFLKKHLRPGDKVQPLDWTGGSHQAMLAAKAELATPFLVDSVFYHAVSDPFIQSLRRRFIDSLNASKPRYIVDVLVKDRPRGLDTTNRFDELEALVAAQYRPVGYHQNLGFIIFERRAGAP
jgi:hypothetical protein